MSLDIYLESPEACPHCGKAILGGAEIHSQNYTHNVTPMWSKAGVYDALYMSEGWLVDEKYLQTIRDGISAFESDKSAYRELNPKNGWGDADGAFSWLAEWLQACENNIGAQIYVSK